LIVPGAVDRESVVETEAESIARFIRADVGARRRGWGDFMVLTCQKRDRDAYARTLEAQRIPVEVSGASGLKESAAVRVLADLPPGAR
jgi:ATP-dependent exoDNAse (exonuclease V) beta subunit